jgi:hypothetical protein
LVPFLAIAASASGLFLFQAHAGIDSPAAISAPDEELADFSEESEASFDDTDANMTAARLNVSNQDHLFHTSHFHPPQLAGQREKRSLPRIAWLQAIPFMLVIAMGTLLSFSRKKAKRKSVLTPKTLLSKKVMLVLYGVLLAGLLTAKISSALTINTSKDTVIGFLGKGQKIYQKYIELTPDHIKQFTTRLGWTPDRTKYKAYYSKSDNQSVDAYVFILEDKLPACGGIHKYGIKVSAKGEVTGIKIMELTCDRSYCINNKAFLRQFKSFNTANAKDKAKTYDAISGATLSTDLTLHIVRRALLLFEITHGAVGG